MTATALADQPATVILAYEEDPYMSLAEEIATAEHLPLAQTFEDALARAPETIVWVVAPSRLSEEVFARLAVALNAHGNSVALGLISGSNEALARALWRRKPIFAGKCIVAVPREGTVEMYERGRLTRQTLLTKQSLAAALSEANIISYQGHGSRSGWHLDEGTRFVAEDVANLPPLVVSAGSCQTFKIWGEDSIAISMIDHGAAAYVGFLHSPLGYMIGEPKSFPLQYTWPDYPVGHVIQVQGRGLTQGHIGWPYWLMLGNPLLALREDPPYRVTSDRQNGDERILRLDGLPPGVVPIRIGEGAGYSYVHIHGVGRAYHGDPFYDPRLQMVDIGAHKYLLAAQDGGDLEVRLSHKTPFWWPAIDALQGALDHTTVLYHVQGSLTPSLLLAGLVGLPTLWRVIRHPDLRARHWASALTLGLGLTCLRAFYAWVRQEDLTSMYVSYLRTTDLTWEVNPIILGATGIICTGSTWLFLGSCRLWSKALAGLLIVAPTSLLALFWFGNSLTLNIAASYYYGGMPLYGYAVGTMALITTMIEAVVAALLLGVIARRRRPVSRLA